MILDRENVVDLVRRAIENVVHVLDLTIVIVVRKTRVNVLVRDHVPKDVIVEVAVEKKRNHDVKISLVFAFVFLSSLFVLMLLIRI